MIFGLFGGFQVCPVLADANERHQVLRVVVSILFHCSTVFSDSFFCANL